MENQQNDRLWELARQRAAFKKNLASYFVVNAFLVAVWYFTGGNQYNRHFWPMWPMLGWGFGLLIQYIGAYRGANWFSAEKEYEALKRKD
jgi:hypothetical protein